MKFMGGNMAITVEDFLNIPILKEATLKTAENTITDRIIESISVIEIPVENFVRKNELVLSTAMGCSSDITIFKEFIKDVFASGAAALCIATGAHVKTIPDEVIKYGEKLNFPIIQLPWDVRFADIIEAVLGLINRQSQANLKRFEDLQKKLLTYYLKGFTLYDAAELIHQSIVSPVVIVNSYGTLKGASNNSEAMLKALGPCIQELSHKDSHESLIIHSSGEAFLSFKIQLENMLHGYLFLKPFSNKKSANDFNINSGNIIRYIVTTIALWFSREQAINETEMQMRDSFIWSLAKGEITSMEDMCSKAESMGYNISNPYICIVGLLEDMESIYKQNKSFYTSFEQWLYHNIKNIKTLIFHTGIYLNKSVMVTYQQDRLIIFLQVTESKVKDEANNFLDLVEDKLKKTYGEMVVSWGIGKNYAGAKAFHESFTDAKIALEIGYNEKGPGHRNTYDKSNVYRLLLALSDNKEAQEIVYLTIGKLIDYDNVHGLDLIHTLKVYNENKGNVSQTARVLHLHRQSLLYRLKKIEMITNLSLEDSDDMFLLDTCVRLWYIKTYRLL